MKFAIKVRDAIIKRQYKCNKDLGINRAESSFNQSIWDIDSEISMLKAQIDPIKASGD